MKLPIRPAASEGGMSGRHEVSELEPTETVLARDPPYRQQHAEKPAVKRHATVPDREDLRRMRRVVAGLVEQNVAEPSAEDHAEHGEKE